MNKIILIIGVCAILFVSGCINQFREEPQITDIPEGELSSNPSTIPYEPCVKIRDRGRTENTNLPEKITVDNNTIEFRNVEDINGKSGILLLYNGELYTDTEIDKFNIFNLTKTIRELTTTNKDLGSPIWFAIYDEEDKPILYQDDYMRCNLNTINKLIELNATDILYDVCVIMPRIRRVKIQAEFRDDEHNVEVCWD